MAAAKDMEEELERLSEEKESLKKRIKAAKDEGKSPDFIQPMYDRYLEVKQLADDLNKRYMERDQNDDILQGDIDEPRGAGLIGNDADDAEDQPTNTVSAGAETLASLEQEKNRLKDLIKEAKANQMSADYIQPLYDKYTAVKERMENWVEPAPAPAPAPAVVRAAPVPAPAPAPMPAAPAPAPYAPAPSAEAPAMYAPPVGSHGGAYPGGPHPGPYPGGPYPGGPHPGGPYAGGHYGGPAGGPPGWDGSRTDSMGGHGGDMVPAYGVNPALLRAGSAATLQRTGSAGSLGRGGAGAAFDGSVVAIEDVEGRRRGGRGGAMKTEGMIMVEESKRFQGRVWKQRYCVVGEQEVICYKERGGKEKLRVPLQGAHIRPVVGEIDKVKMTGFELMTKKGLSKSDIFMADSKAEAKAWFRAIWKAIKNSEDTLKTQLTFPDPPDGYDGKVLHLEWLEVHMKGSWQWRYFVLADFCLNFYEEQPLKSEDLRLNPKVAKAKNLCGTFPLVGSLRREYEPELDRKHVFVMFSNDGFSLPIATYSDTRLRQWITGVDITARRALHARVTLGEITYEGEVERYERGGRTPVDLIFTSSRISLFRRGAKVHNPNPNFQFDLEFQDDAAQRQIWQHSYRQLKQFSKEENAVVLDFSKWEEQPVRFFTNQVHEVGNLLGAFLIELQRATRRRSKKRRKAKSRKDGPE